MSAVDLKLVLLGHKNVGKTSIFNRYVYDEFGRTSMTIGAYFGMKQLRVQERMVNLAIWDTAGEEKFDALTSFYCRGASCALICYDITAFDTFTSLQRWIDKLKNEADPACCIVIVGNKVDVVESNPSHRRVEFGDARRYAASVGATVLEVSAKTGVNVSEAFQTVTQLCIEKQLRSKEGNTNSTTNINNTTTGTRRTANLNAPKETNKGCCS